MNASETEFHTGWFVESLATQVLVIFAIRTRRSPFWRSRPSRLLVAAAFSAVTAAILLPISPLATLLGFSALPLPFWAALATFVVAYLVIVEASRALRLRVDAAEAASGQPSRSDRGLFVTDASRQRW